MTLTERFANESATKQKAAAYDAMVNKAQLQDAFSTARALGNEEGYAAKVADDARNWDGSFSDSIQQNPIIPPQNGRMDDGGYMDSVEENPIILPNGKVISAEQARGLAARATEQDARVRQSIVPPAATQYPTYKGQ